MEFYPYSIRIRRSLKYMTGPLDYSAIRTLFSRLGNLSTLEPTNTLILDHRGVAAVITQSIEYQISYRPLLTILLKYCRLLFQLKYILQGRAAGSTL